MIFLLITIVTKKLRRQPSNKLFWILLEALQNVTEAHLLAKSAATSKQPKPNPEAKKQTTAQPAGCCV
jgi:hypothetical protein